MDLLDSNDVTQGEEAYAAFIDLCHVVRNKDQALTITAAEDGDDFVIVEGEAETLALTQEQAVRAATVLTMAAALFDGDDEYAARHSRRIAEVLNEAVADLIGAGGETVH